MVASKKEIKEIYENVNSKKDLINAFLLQKEKPKVPTYVKFANKAFDTMKGEIK